VCCLTYTIYQNTLKPRENQRIKNIRDEREKSQLGEEVQTYRLRIANRQALGFQERRI
jgi:hypothetical protein